MKTTYSTEDLERIEALERGNAIFFLLPDGTYLHFTTYNTRTDSQTPVALGLDVEAFYEEAYGYVSEDNSQSEIEGMDAIKIALLYTLLKDCT